MGAADDGPFSDELERWLLSDEPKTLGAMNDVFAEKSFAVTIMLLMFVPALPLPTGGVTHVFEAITVLLAAQMVLGRRTIWLPARWNRRDLGATADRRRRSPSSCGASARWSGSRARAARGSSRTGGRCAFSACC